MNALNKIFTAAATAAVLLSSGAAFADTTREQVTAELAQARASGALEAMNSDQPFAFMQAPVATGTSRAQVVADLKQARASGELAAKTSEIVPTATRVASSKTRAQVIAELRASQADGTLALQHSEDALDQIRVTQMLQNKAAASVMAE